MTLTPVFDTFNLQTVQACVKYLLDSMEWLTADGDNFSRYAVYEPRGAVADFTIY